MLTPRTACSPCSKKRGQRAWPMGAKTVLRDIRSTWKTLVVSAGIEICMDVPSRLFDAAQNLLFLRQIVALRSHGETACPRSQRSLLLAKTRPASSGRCMLLVQRDHAGASMDGDNPILCLYPTTATSERTTLMIHTITRSRGRSAPRRGTKGGRENRTSGLTE